MFGIQRISLAASTIVVGATLVTSEPAEARTPTDMRPLLACKLPAVADNFYITPTSGGSYRARMNFSGQPGRILIYRNDFIEIDSAVQSSVLFEQKCLSGPGCDSGWNIMTSIVGNGINSMNHLFIPNEIGLDVASSEFAYVPVKVAIDYGTPPAIPWESYLKVGFKVIKTGTTLTDYEIRIATQTGITGSACGSEDNATCFISLQVANLACEPVKRSVLLP